MSKKDRTQLMVRIGAIILAVLMVAGLAWVLIAQLKG